MAKIYIFLILAFLFFLTQEIDAQNEFNMLNFDNSLIYITFDFDPAPAISIGYAQNFAVDAIKRNVTLSIELMKPIFLNDLQNFQIEIGSRVRIAGTGNFK